MIHSYKLNGYNIVMDINSGAVHVVDDIIYYMINSLEDGPVPEVCPEEVMASLEKQYSRNDLEDVYEDIKELYAKGQLFSSDDYEQFADLMISAPIKAMCLNVAHDCNLRCKYCFAATGDFGGGRKLMPLETGKKAIDYLLRYSGNRHNLEMDFFGGEPLMNWPVVKEIVKYARSKEKEYNKNFRFTITTNGMLLTEDKWDFLNKEMKNVVLSLDGRKEVNDNLRVRVDGSGSYDIIVPHFQEFVKRRGDQEYYIRGTFTKYNLDFTNDVFDFYNKGFEQISIEPVVTDPKEPYALTEEDLPKVFAEYDKLSKKIIETRKNGEFFNFFHFMIDLNQGPCAIKRLRGCGCGNEYVCVTPEGDVYPCHQFVGKKEWIMGSVHDMSLNTIMKDDFAKATVYDKPECKKCWAKFYCSGGCNANNQEHCGDIRKPFKLSCELEKKRLECAIMIQAALAELGLTDYDDETADYCRECGTCE